MSKNYNINENAQKIEIMNKNDLNLEDFKESDIIILIAPLMILPLEIYPLLDGTNDSNSKMDNENLNMHQLKDSAKQNKLLTSILPKTTSIIENSQSDTCVEKQHSPSIEQLKILPSYYFNQIPKFKRNQDRWRSYIGALLMTYMFYKREKIYGKGTLVRLNTGKWTEQYNNSSNFISVNASHSNNLIVYGSTSQWHIGIDIQFFDKKKYFLEYIESILTENEANICKSNTEMIYMYWCLKEACLKALGFGLSFNPTRIEIELIDSLVEHNEDRNENVKITDILDCIEFDKNDYRIKVDGELKDWKLYCKSFYHHNEFYCFGLALIPLNENLVHKNLLRNEENYTFQTILNQKNIQNNLKKNDQYNSYNSYNQVDLDNKKLNSIKIKYLNENHLCHILTELLSQKS